MGFPTVLNFSSARPPLAAVLAAALVFAIPPQRAVPAAPDTASASRAQPVTQAAPSRGKSNPTELIDRLISEGWQSAGLVPSATATDGEWCRRVFLDIVGRIPTVDELNAFLRLRAPAKKAELIDRLLGEPYRDAYASHWSTVWTNVLIGRTGGLERRSFTNRAGMQEYLREAFSYDKPYDQMVYELITARGETRPGEEGFNGATNFLAMKLSDNAVQATAKTSQIFLGVQVQCTQCHNHPFNEWKQSQFWQLNAFFRQTRALRRFDQEGRYVAGVELADQDFPGEGGNPAEAELYYELPNGLLKVAYPVFIDGTDLTSVLGEEKGKSGYLEDVNRREQLAKLVLQSRNMDQAVVNRIWAHFLGYGFTKPVDDMGPHNPPTHPELLDQLGLELRQSGFDLKQLIRWITLSEPYALSSRMKAKNQADDPTLGTRPLFSHFYLRQMTAESLYESLIVATEADKTRKGDKEQAAAKKKWLDQLTKAFGTDDNDETTTFNGTIPQALMLMNGELVRQATSAEKGSFLYRVATDAEMKNSQKIRHLYLAALARQPSRREIRLCNELLTLRNGDVAAALQDIWWALLNNNEFILNH